MSSSASGEKGDEGTSPGSSGEGKSRRKSFGQRARSLKEEFLEIISHMRSQGASGAHPKTPSTPAIKKKSSSSLDVSQEQNLAKDLEHRARQVRVALSHFRNVVTKSHWEMLPGNGTVILETVTALQTLQNKYVHNDFSSALVLASNRAHGSVARLLKFCDDYFLFPEDVFAKDNVSEFVSEAESNIENWIALMNQELVMKVRGEPSGAAGFSTLPPSRKPKTLLERSGLSLKRGSLPKTPRTSSKRGAPENATVVGIEKQPENLGDVLNESPSTKPPVPVKAKKSKMAPPPLPPKKRKLESVFGGAQDRLSIRSESPDGSVSSLESIFNQLRVDEDELRVLAESPHDANKVYEGLPPTLSRQENPRPIFYWANPGVISSGRTGAIVTTPTVSDVVDPPATAADNSLAKFVGRLSGSQAESGFGSILSQRSSSQSYSASSQQLSSTRSSQQSYSSQESYQTEKRVLSPDASSSKASSTVEESEAAIASISASFKELSLEKRSRSQKTSEIGSIEYGPSTSTRTTFTQVSSEELKIEGSRFLSSSLSSTSFSFPFITPSPYFSPFRGSAITSPEDDPPTLPVKAGNKFTKVRRPSLSAHMQRSFQTMESSQESSHVNVYTQTEEEESVVIEEESIAVKEESIAIKEESVVIEEESIAVKEESIAVKEESIAVKEESIAIKEESIAIKEESIAVEEESIATEEESIATEEESIAIKEESIAIKEESIAIEEESISASLKIDKEDSGSVAGAVLPDTGDDSTTKGQISKNTKDQAVQTDATDQALLRSRLTLDLTPPPLPPKKRPIMAYMEMFGNASHSTSDEFLRHSVHAYKMLQNEWLEQQRHLSTASSCCFNYATDSNPSTPVRKPVAKASNPSVPPALPPKKSKRKPSGSDAAVMQHQDDSNSTERNAPSSSSKEVAAYSVTKYNSDEAISSPLGSGEERKPYEFFLNSDVPVIESLDAVPHMQLKKVVRGVFVVKGGSVDALIAHAANSHETDYMYEEAFIITYRTFITPLELFQKLVHRYDKLYASQYEDEQKASKNTFDFIVRTADSLTLLDLDHDLVQTLMDLVHRVVRRGCLNMGATLRNIIIQRCESKKLYNTMKSIVAPHSSTTRTSIFDFKSEQIAEQMTMMDAELFLRIESPEILTWAEDQREDLSPNLSRFTVHFNKMSYWTRSRILEQRDSRSRERYLLKFVKIMKHLRKINNFNSCLALLSALDSAPVRRLDWQKNVMEGIQEHSDLIDSTSSFRAYRLALADSQPPCIPYIGLVLQDLTFINAGNPNLLPDGSINFSKRWQQYDVIQNMARFKIGLYNYRKNEKIIKFFNDFDDALSEEEMWQLSEKLKPRPSKNK